MAFHIGRRAAVRSSAVWAVILASVQIPSVPVAAQNGNPPPAKPWYQNVIFKGFIQLDAIFPEGNSLVGIGQGDTATGQVSNFRIRRARPTFIIPIDPLTRVQLQMDLSTPRCAGGQSNVTITDTFAERTIPKIGVFQFGNNLLPFSREVHEDNAAIRSPLELSFAGEQIALAERDLGIFIHGPTLDENHGVHWEAALVNGQGVRSADANANKTLVGRVTVPIAKQLRAGIDGIYGTYNSNGKDWDRRVLGWEFHSPISKALNLGGEFYKVRFVDNPAKATKVARYDGGYLLLESWIGKLKSIPYFRYQRTYGDLDYRSYDLGWRYQYAANQRITFEYDIVSGHQRNYGAVRWQLGW